jgi:hypothetical protein
MNRAIDKDGWSTHFLSYIVCVYTVALISRVQFSRNLRTFQRHIRRYESKRQEYQRYDKQEAHLYEITWRGEHSVMAIFCGRLQQRSRRTRAVQVPAVPAVPAMSPDAYPSLEPLPCALQFSTDAACLIAATISSPSVMLQARIHTALCRP